ncbi:MAG: LLM class flavin-dependent oxidoreductase [Lysobacteraceae bacterium]|nr:MAG: LLM class flavin-dependent oxidoreductase [Xanthomonadaceae bacterium]
MHLGAMLYPTGYHVAAWRDPDVPPRAGIDFAHLSAMARAAERGKFDFVFLADSLAVRGRDLQALSRTAIRYIGQFDPLTLLPALAVVTERIGLVGSASTTYNDPYHIARKLASIDHISGGRAGWNLVTSQNEDEAFNFGADAHPPHAERYRRAAEFTDVLKGLWNSWEDDAFVNDKASGQYFDPDKVHVLGHRGAFFSVRGPLNVPRPPQGFPVLVQSGSSEDGKDLAARMAEVVFTAQPTIEEARAFYADVKARIARNGRDPAEVKVLVGAFPYVGRTRQEAEDKRARLSALIDPAVALSLLATQLGSDVSNHPLDGPLPEELPDTNQGKSRRALLIEMARRERMTIRQLCEFVAASRGHWTLMGDPGEIADQMQTWVREGAADGFIVMPPTLPDGLVSFVDLVIPELQRRDAFRREYAGTTLREHFGLRRPPHPAAVAPEAGA